MIKLLLLSTLLLCSWCSGQGRLGSNWLQGLHEDIDRLNRNINENVRQLNREIHERVQTQLKDVDELTKNINATAQRSAGAGTGSTVYIDGVGGGTRWTYRGQGQDNSAIYRDIQDKIVGHILFRTERIRDPKSGEVREYRYRLDLSDPKARLTPIEDES